MSYPLAELLLLCTVVTLCALSDLATAKIYNHVTYPAAVLGLVMALLSGGPSELLMHAAGLAIGFAPFFIFFLFKGMGGGDVKLMAAVGAIVGYPMIGGALFHTLLVGGVVAVSVMLWKGVLWRGIRNSLWTIVTWALPMPTQKLNPANSQKIPFGVAIALGSIWATVEGLSLIAW